MLKQIAGVDEVGRGALFGPVVAAAVILPTTEKAGLQAAGVKDSKCLQPVQRRRLAELIKATASAYCVGLATVYEIDRLNILQASLLAMRRAILGLPLSPRLCMVDGNQLIPMLPFPQETRVKGDRDILEIAAASILAKVWRDTLIERLDRRYPGYDLAANKGYASVRHRAALANLGPTRQHRLSFRSCQVKSLDLALPGS